MEEYVWRWFVFRKFEVLLGGKLAVPAAALAFTAHHVIVLAAQFDWPIAVLGSCGVFIGGAAWSWLYLRYGSTGRDTSATPSRTRRFLSSATG